MKKLTRKHALEICQELWTWLSNPSNKFKSFWPGWTNLKEKGFKNFSHACPCCQYVVQFHPKWNRHGFLCSKKETNDEPSICPLKSLWPEGCESRNSPYRKWSICNDSDEYARQIANACKKELKKYKTKGAK